MIKLGMWTLQVRASARVGSVLGNADKISLIKDRVIFQLTNYVCSTASAKLSTPTHAISEVPRKDILVCSERPDVTQIQSM